MVTTKRNKTKPKSTRTTKAATHTASKSNIANSFASLKINPWVAIFVILGVVLLGYVILMGKAATITPGASVTIPRAVPYTSLWWQLEGTLNATALSSDPNQKRHYDFDFEDITATKITNIKSQGALATCYFEVGTAAEWRDDYSKFPSSALSGTNPNNWGDEKWIDIMDPTVRSIMAARMDKSKTKGCQGIEPDWLDNYTYTQSQYDSSGKLKVPTKAQQLDYMKFLADEAHARGMMIALKNVPELATEKFADGRIVADVYDWALIEECTVSYKSTCQNLQAFIQRGKNVTVAEYNDQMTQANFTGTVCTQLNSWNFDGYLFDRNNGGSPTLTGKVRIPCRTGQGQTAVPTTTVTVFPGSTTTSTVSPTTTVTTTSTVTPTTTTTVTITPTPNNQVPIGPASLTATAVSTTQINLSWPSASDDSPGSLGYILTRNGTKIYSGTNLNYSDTGLTASITYNYQVVAIDVGLLTSTGASTSAKTLDAPTPTSDTTAPSAPGNVKASVNFDYIKFAYYTKLSWSASYDNVGIASYEIKRNGSSIGSTTSTSFKDYGILADTFYSYDIYASDKAGNVSAPANARFVGRCFLIWCWAE